MPLCAYGTGRNGGALRSNSAEVGRGGRPAGFAVGGRGEGERRGRGYGSWWCGRSAARGGEDSGADALAGLADAPDDVARAEALAAALAARAAADPLFAEALTAWHRTAQTAVPVPGSITNTVTGGTQSTVVQARDIHGGLHFGPPQGS